jgi:hypothetical protein
MAAPKGGEEGEWSILRHTSSEVVDVNRPKNGPVPGPPFRLRRAARLHSMIDVMDKEPLAAAKKATPLKPSKSQSLFK